MVETDRAAHHDECGYAKWYDKNFKWQPASPLSQIAREVIAEEVCTCNERQGNG